MYQALYRKWRPRTFDDVVGQAHITDTLKRQVEGNRLSHAYLFTGTRGTGKTTCAKILARAVNCEHPVQGNPCNACPACLGIESGAILDVLELDAASNNGVDQVRALRDEAVYTPAAVRKRVYIVDEVHMLSTPAFNALLKILEEPPEHLMFILATTELHKVPATIKSRCQQFAFKRILPGDITQRLGYVARQEGLDLTADAAALLARLADGGLRDALSLLDQCSGGGGTIDESRVLGTLGLAGNLETARLMELISAGDAAQALETLDRLYRAGKDVSSMLSELSGLTRDLLLRRTAPQGAATLLTGGFDESTMRSLGERFTAPRLMQMLTLLQQTLADLGRSTNRRTDAELCLIRLCDITLDDSLTGLTARLARLEQLMSCAVSVPAPVAAPVKPKPKQDDLPPWEEERPPLPPEPEEAPTPQIPTPPRQETSKPEPAPAAANGEFWPSFCAGLHGLVPPSAHPLLTNAAMVTGTWSSGVLTLWVRDEFTKALLNKPAITEAMAKAASTRFGQPTRVVFTIGKAPAQSSAPAPQPAPEADALDQLLDFGSKFDNIVIE
ncbi:MAG: DNA polymerase III subunit gamma/tau [Ruminococcaceae bacterium]|nr:DNA polymerase III subunit gamma/tau [Oscillospiraceae bacterium]